MLNEELRKRVAETRQHKSYRQTKRETNQEYSIRLASIIYRGWSFLSRGKDNRAWFEERVKEIEAILNEQ